MILPLRPIHQTTPTECYKACLKMVLSYYNQETSDEELDKFIIVGEKGGAYLDESARFAATKGFKTRGYGYYLGVLNPSDGKKTRRELIAHLKNYQPAKWQVKSNNFKSNFESWLASLEAGAQYRMKKPSSKIILKYLTKKIPLIISVNSSALRDRHEDPLMLHSIVVIGYEGNLVSIIDPRFGIVEQIDIKNVLFGIQQSRIITHSLYMLAIWK